MELGVRLEQNQILAPRMEQSVRILQMDGVQLGEYLKELALENPVAEVEPPPQREQKEKLAQRKLEWLENQTRREQENMGYYDDDGDLTPEQNTPAPQDESLTDHLLAQVESAAVPRALAAAARYVIGCLDDNGYLKADPEQMRAKAGACDALLERAIALVQSFDPPGVGARDLAECLCLQIPASDALARRLARDFLPEIAKKRVGVLAAKTGASAGEVEAAVARIRRLNPKPGALYGAHVVAHYITPDILVTSFGDHYNVMLCEFAYPQVRLSDSYLQIARETADPEVIKYIGEKIDQVNWVIKCIENRNRTLVEVARAIVRQQERFFRYGPQHLGVLRMREIAGLVGLHESTVSRAVRGKYLQCAHGVYPLRYFFVKGPEHGGAVSSETVKYKLRALIDTEDRARPFSDRALCELLAADGVSISRRTVAKYRGEMGVPGASGRTRG